MAVTTLPVSGFEPAAAEAAPAGRLDDADDRPRRMAAGPQGELAVPIFDDDGVMIRVVLTEDEDLD